jgi:thiopurine S-methyltransferase
MERSEDYWDQRYREGRMGWDIGSVSTPLKEYIDQLPSTDLDILVPGAGNGYEVDYLYQKGFHSVYALDISKVAFEQFRGMNPGFPEDQFLLGDFFSLEGRKFDLILEQTFFCALQPELRVSYAQKMQSLLKDQGILAGLLFDFPFNGEGPPYGGNAEEYRELFSPFFKIRKLERAYNSIPPRQGNELFFIFEQKTS